VEGEAGSSAYTTFRGLSQWIPEPLQVRFLQAVASEPRTMVRRWEDRLDAPSLGRMQNRIAKSGV